MKLILTRDVSRLECPWLDADMVKGQSVWTYEGCTYGCVSSNGRAVSKEEGKTPFFELPRDALREVKPFVSQCRRCETKDCLQCRHDTYDRE
jgi:hypothetical protein